MQIHLYFFGKPRNNQANTLAAEFLKRAGRYCRCQSRQIRQDRFDPWAAHPAALKILLDPAGKALDSAGFAALVERCQGEARDLVFLVGGADGLPAAWKPRADLLLSLSAMTLPHELARVVLAEQIYRALARLRGHPYPR